MHRRISFNLIISCIILASCTSGTEHETNHFSNSKKAETSTQETGKHQGFKRVNAKEAHQLLTQMPDAVVLDVRTPQEFGEGHLQEATNIDFRNSAFEEHIDQLDKDKTYFVHCKSGARSSQAFEMMQENGFKNVYHIDGGILAWEAAGFKTNK